MNETSTTLAMCLITMSFAIVAALLVFLSSIPEPVDPYCEMVGRGIDSNGEYGWPDYRKNYHTECHAIPLEGGAPITQGEEK